MPRALSPCCRSHPATVCAVSASLRRSIRPRPTVAGSASGAPPRARCAHVCDGPVTATILTMAWSMRSGPRFPPPRHPRSKAYCDRGGCVSAERQPGWTYNRRDSFLSLHANTCQNITITLVSNAPETSQEDPSGRTQIFQTSSIWVSTDGRMHVYPGRYPTSDGEPPEEAPGCSRPWSTSAGRCVA